MIFDDNYMIILLFFSIKTYVVGAHLNHLNEAILMSSLNVGFPTV